jgi:hypothetical protein
MIPSGAADVADLVTDFVALDLANELRAAGSQASDDGVVSSTAKATWRMPGVFAGGGGSPPWPGGV